MGGTAVFDVVIFTIVKLNRLMISGLRPFNSLSDMSDF